MVTEKGDALQVKSFPLLELWRAAQWTMNHEATTARKEVLGGDGT